MKKRLLVNLFLLLCVISLFSFYQYRQSSQPEIQRLTPLDLSSISSITIPRDGQEDIIFRKLADSSSNKPWRMIQPYQLAAHQFRIATLLAISQIEFEESYTTGSLNLKDYALDPPRARIIFNQTEVAFGNTNPVNGKRYILSGDRLILLLDKSYPLVSASASSLIDLSPLEAGAVITGFQLPGIELEKKPDGTWLRHNDTSLNIDQINRLIDHWTSATAFAAHRYNRRDNSRQIKLIINGASITFEYSHEASWFILARPDTGIEYHFDISYQKKLLGDE